MSSRIVLYSLLAAWWAAAPAAAGTVTLANGDRVSGQIARLADAVLVVTTDWGGEVEIAWEAVTAIESAEPLTVVLADGTRVTGIVEAGNILRADTLGAPLELVLASVSAINPPPGKPPIELRGHVAFGVVATGGNTDTQSIYGEGELVARSQQNRYTLGAQGTRAEDDGRTTSDSLRGWTKYDHFFTQRWFLASSVLATRDEFQDLSLRTAFSLSSGFQARESERTKLGLEAGLSYVSEDFLLSPDDSYPAARWALDFEHGLVPKKIGVFHAHELLVGLESADNLLLRSRTGLRFTLYEGFVAATQVNYDYDESPSPGRESADWRYLLNLGFEF